jgi:hypothetical protein
MERSLRAASEVKELSLDNLEPTSRQDNNKEWEQVDGCFEHLHRSLSILYENKDDSEQFFFSMKELEDKFHHLRRTLQRHEAYLMETVRRQKISIDSLFEDLVFARDQLVKFKTLLAQFEAVQATTAYGARAISFLDAESAGLDAASIHPRSYHGESEAKQSDILESIIKKQVPKRQKSVKGLRRFFGPASRPGSRGPVGTVEDPDAAALLEERCRKIDEENQSLKFTLVKAQLLYKEETYKLKKAMEELQLANEAVTLKNIALLDAVDQTYDGSDRRNCFDAIVDSPICDNSASKSIDGGPDDPTSKALSHSSPPSAKIMRV